MQDLVTAGRTTPVPSSQADPTGQLEERQRAIGDIIDRYRVGRQWRALDNDTQMATVQTFLAVLDGDRIPFRAYELLYKHYTEAKAKAMALGYEIPEFCPETLVALWHSGVKDTYAESQPRRLSATAQTGCPKCFGTGFEEVYENGVKVGVRKGCEHDGVIQEEPQPLPEFIQSRIPRDRIEESYEVCRRVYLELWGSFITAAAGEDVSDIEVAIRTWNHAEAYCRKHDKEGR